MKIVTVILVALGIPVAFITSYWVLISRLRVQHRELEALSRKPTGVNDVIYRSPDPSGDSERQNKLSQLAKRISIWEERRRVTLFHLLRVGKYGLGLGLGLAVVLAIGALIQYVRIYRVHKYPVSVVIIDRIWKCDVGALLSQGHEVVMESSPARSYGQVIPAICPNPRQNGEFQGTRIQYYWLVEATANYPIIRRGERFIREVDLANYTQGTGNRRNWMFSVSGDFIHRHERPFHQSYTPQGVPWPER